MQLTISNSSLYIYLLTVCTQQLINAPHIYTYVDQDSVIAGLRDSANGTLPK